MFSIILKQSIINDIWVCKINFFWYVQVFDHMNKGIIEHFCCLSTIALRLLSSLLYFYSNLCLEIMIEVFSQSLAMDNLITVLTRFFFIFNFLFALLYEVTFFISFIIRCNLILRVLLYHL